MSHKHTVFTMNSALFSKTSVFTMNYAHFSLKTVSSSKTTVFTMNYALFFKNHSFYNELYTVRLGAMLGPFWHREGSMAEPSRAEPGRAGPGRAEPSRARAIPSRAPNWKKPIRSPIQKRSEPSPTEPIRAAKWKNEPRRAEPEAIHALYLSKTTVFTMNYTFLYPLQIYQFLQWIWQLCCKNSSPVYVEHNFYDFC